MHLLVLIHDTSDSFQAQYKGAPTVRQHEQKLQKRPLQGLHLPKHNRYDGHHKRDSDVIASIIPDPLCFCMNTHPCAGSTDMHACIDPVEDATISYRQFNLTNDHIFKLLFI